MSVVEYPPKSYSKLKRQQLETVAIALEEQRDRAPAQVASARSNALKDAAEALEAQPPKLRAQYVEVLTLYAAEPWLLEP